MLTLFRRLLDALAGLVVLGVWLREPPPPARRLPWTWRHRWVSDGDWFGEVVTLTNATRRLVICLDPRRPLYEQEPSWN